MPKTKVKDYRELDDDQLKNAVEAIVRSSATDEEMQERVAAELQYDFNFAVNHTMYLGTPVVKTSMRNVGGYILTFEF